MKTRLAVLASCALLVAVAALNGCANNRASVQVQAICFPTDDCSFQSECDAYFGGTAGINGTGTLVLFLQVANQLPNNQNVSNGRLNTNDAHVTEIVIEYEGAQNNTQYQGANSWVPAGGSTVVPLGLLITATGAMVAHVRLNGHYDDGSSFETGEFPIAVAAGASACPSSACATAATTCPPGGAGQCPVACDASSTTPATTYTVGGTISGLTADGLTLSTPGRPDLSVAGGSSTFQFTGVSDGAAYNVTIVTQPAGQTCTVTAGTGSGTVSAGNVSSVAIT